jgi:glyoxylate carboligase
MPQSTVASFLTQRLKQIGLRHAFGVPGDYVLTFMDRLIASGIEFVGTCNELNAGYAADAYARINGVGCVCVTWGVGGFSAMNAVAGAYAEQVPVVVLVGSPRTMQRRSSMLLHHGVGDFTTMQQAYSHITVASVLLDDAAEAPQRIDQALARCMAEKRPIMIEIPVDMVDRSCQTPGPFAPPSRPPSDPEALHEALDEVMGLLSSASRAVILGGAELHRYGLMQDFYRLVEASALPVATTLLGKTVISENHPQAIGVYEGGTSRKEIRDIVENSDVLLCLGAWVSDINFGLQTRACRSYAEGRFAASTVHECFEASGYRLYRRAGPRIDCWPPCQTDKRICGRRHDRHCRDGRFPFSRRRSCDASRRRLYRAGVLSLDRLCPSGDARCSACRSREAARHLHRRRGISDDGAGAVDALQAQEQCDHPALEQRRIYDRTHHS